MSEALLHVLPLSPFYLSFLPYFLFTFCLSLIPSLLFFPLFLSSSHFFSLLLHSFPLLYPSLLVSFLYHGSSLLLLPFSKFLSFLLTGLFLFSPPALSFISPTTFCFPSILPLSSSPLLTSFFSFSFFLLCSSFPVVSFSPLLSVSFLLLSFY